MMQYMSSISKGLQDLHEGHTYTQEEVEERLLGKQEGPASNKTSFSASLDQNE